jgi:hypothetical protein
MKRFFNFRCIVVFLLCIFLLNPSFVFAEPLRVILRIGSKQAIINNSIKILDVAPLIQNERTFVPLRFVGETFGAEIYWKEDSDNSGEGSICLSFHQSNTTLIKIKMHTQVKTVLIETIINNQNIPDVASKILDVYPFVKKPENRTMVPLRFISEVLLAKVSWIAESKEIIIQKEAINSIFAKTLESGNHPEIEWEKMIQGSYHQFGSFIQQTVDGGYIIAGTSTLIDTTEICIIKLDSSGEVVWQNYYRKEALNYGVAIYQTPDNGFLVFGNTISINNNKSDIYIIKINFEGLVLWDKTIGEELDYRIFAVMWTNRIVN